MSGDRKDLVKVGYMSHAWLRPTCELRFVSRNGGTRRILQQKWTASETELERGHQIKYEVWRWKDVSFDENPEPDTAKSVED